MQPYLEELLLRLRLQVGDTVGEPGEDAVLVHLDGGLVLHQGVPQLFAARPGEVEVALLEQEHHEVEVGVHGLLVGVQAVNQSVRLKKKHS